MAPLRDSELRVRSLRAPMIEAGPEGDSKAVVFVHGNPGSSRDWVDLVGRCGDFARALAIDMPGFGQADKPRDWDYNVGSYATFLQDAFEQLGVERAHLVVHDFGGPFGLLWGLQHPDAWASIVIINTGVLVGYRWHTMARRWRTPVVGELVQLWVPRFAWRKGMQKAGVPTWFADEMHRNYDRGTRRAVLKLYRATPDPGDTAEQLAPVVAALDKPALVIWGAKDVFIGPENAEIQKRSFPRAEVVLLEGSGHWPFIDDPEGVAAAALPFLREQLGATAS